MTLFILGVALIIVGIIFGIISVCIQAYINIDLSKRISALEERNDYEA